MNIKYVFPIGKILPFLFIFIYHVSFSQEDFQLPDYVMPSPQASEITKHGNVSVNEALGMISPSIPLYEYQVGSLNLPINLAYSGMGVKISDLPTWTGNNWHLNAGGVITRTVQDLPDETFSPRVFNSEDFLNNSEPAYLKSLANHPRDFDTQTDIFYFEFAGISGSFYLEINRSLPEPVKPVLLNTEQELKIIIDGNFNYGDNYHYSFIIITSDGTKYFFGDLIDNGIDPASYAIEETQFIDRTGSEPIFGIKAKTSFYLTKIENYLGDKIYLDYHTKDTYEVLSIVGQKLTLNVTPPNPNSLLNSPGLDPNLGLYPFTQKVKNKIYNGKYLKKIWGSIGDPIYFNSFEVQTVNQYYRVLSDIDFTQKIIDLEYYPLKDQIESAEHNDKFFLKNVTFKDDSSINKEFEYALEYDGLDFTSLFDLSKLRLDSYAQDYLGYYNSQSGNSNLVPKLFKKFVPSHLSNLPSNLLNKLNDAEEYNLANREPEFQYAKTGALTRITYPTGGFTNVEYEPVDKKIINNTMNLNIYSNMGQANPAWTPNSKYTASYMIGELAGGPGPPIDMPDYEPVPPVFQTEAVRFDITINTLSPQWLDHHDFIYLKIRDNESNREVIERFKFPVSVMQIDGDGTNFNKSFYYTLKKDNSYSISIGFGNGFGSNTVFIGPQNTNAFSSTPMTVNCVMKYTKGYDQFEGLGLRVKKTKDYVSENSEPIIKRFYYRSALEFDSFSEPRVFAPYFLSFSWSQIEEEIYTISDGNTLVHEDRMYAIVNSTPSVLNFLRTHKPFYRHVVTSFGGNNFENGGIDKQFRVIGNQNPRNLTLVEDLLSDYEKIMAKSLAINEMNKVNNSINNGKIEREYIILKKGDELFKTFQTDYSYHFSENGFLLNLSGIRMKPMDLLSPDDFVNNDEVLKGNFFFGLYEFLPIKTTLTQQRTKEFIDPIPLSSYLPPILEQGYQYQDEDGDGVLNMDDEDFITPEIFETLTEEDIEDPYRKIVATTDYEYQSEFTGQPTKIKASTSTDNEFKETRYYYIDDVNSVLGLTNGDLANYQVLKDDHRINSPIQTENYFKRDNVSTKLSSQRTIYSMEEGIMQPSVIQASKGEDALEDRVEFIKYENGNPSQVRLKDGSITKYLYNQMGQVTLKIENYKEDSNNENPVMTGMDCDDINSLYEGSLVTSYFYNSLTHQINRIVDPRCNTIYYEYDEMHRLKYVKDKDGNILSENEYSYQTQN